MRHGAIIPPLRARSGRSRRTQARLIATTLALASAAGCSAYRPAPLSAADQAAMIGARSLDNPRLLAFVAAEQGAAPAGGRWGLADLTLAALYYHPDLDIARARLAEANAGVVTARQLPNPSISFEDLAYGAGGVWTVAPVINFVIETFGKRGDRTREARALAQAARLDLATASWQVRGRVRDALLDLWASLQRLALLHQQAALQDQLVTLVDHRAIAGQASSLEAGRETINRDQLTVAISGAQRAAIDARARLASAIGVPLGALDGADLQFSAFARPVQPPADLGAQRRAALVGRADIQALLAGYRAADAAVAFQMASRYPDIGLSPGIGFDSGRSAYRLLPEAELPVFNQNQGPIAQAEARRQLAAARLMALQTQVIDAVDGASAQYRAASEALASARALAGGEQGRVAEMQRSFAVGALDRPSLLAAQLADLLARQSLADAAVDQRRALGALEDALQQKLFDPGPPPQASPASPRLASASAP